MSNELLDYQQFLSQKAILGDIKGLSIETTNDILFDFQRDIVNWALQKGRACIFADCGLGKTAMQLAWAYDISQSVGDVLVVAPLGVAKQTERDSLVKYHVACEYSRTGEKSKTGITITNYEMLEHFNPADFSGVVLDESSILKSYTGTTKRKIFDMFKDTRFKLACTATPSPNDHMELLNHAAFLGIMESHEALSIWFINDTMQAGSYRLKKHAEDDFWRWVCSWAVSISKPSDLGFDDCNFVLPPLNEIDVIVRTDMSRHTDGMLFRMPNLSATEYYKELDLTSPERIEKTAEIVNSTPEQFLVWCITNAEAELLRKKISDCVEIRGSDSIDKKEQAAVDFIDGKIKCLISKPSIFGYGLNFQNCHNTIFCGMSYSFEDYYQAVRRLYRFQQKSQVNAYLVIGETEKHILDVIHGKQLKYEELKENMQKHVNKFQNLKTESKFFMDYQQNIVESDCYKAIKGDSIEEIKQIPDRSIGLSVFSPPFSNLYIYSDSLRDMGNCKDDDEFFKNFEYLVPELFRITMNGRLCVIHCKDLMKYKNRDGVAGLKDFPGDIIRLFEKHGWQYHSKVTIWKDPVIEMQRTKSHGLLYKQVCKDSTYSRQGCPDYLVVMRKWTETDDSPVTTGGERFNHYVGQEEEVKCGFATAGSPHGKSDSEGNDYENRGYSIHVWQRYASPVWFDIRQTNVLNIQAARDDKDEKHICPLQLDVIERAIHLWSNKGDTIFSPFMGIGSEGYGALELGRKFIGIELKESYFNQAVKNLEKAANRKEEGTLFAGAEE